MNAEYILNEPDQLEAKMWKIIEAVAELDDLEGAKNALREMRTEVTGSTVREYWLYEVAGNGDLSSLDCSEWPK